MDIQNYQTTLSALHSGFIVCALLAAIFFVVAILMFWRFGMFSIIRQRFGIEAKRSMAEFKEQNETTGVPKYHSIALGERTPRAGLKPGDAPSAAPSAVQTFEQNSKRVSVGEPLTASLDPDEGSAPLTTRLQNSESPSSSAEIAGFEVTKNALLIHTPRDTLVP
jgi:hypothetical protein